MNKDLKEGKQKCHGGKRSHSQKEKLPTKKETKLMPDDITKNLKNLKQVRFLNNEKDQLPTDARRETEKTTQLA
jgi:hypothetical protein